MNAPADAPGALRRPSLRGWVIVLGLVLLADGAIILGVFGGRLPFQYEYDITPENEARLLALLAEVEEEWPDQRVYLEFILATKFDIGVQALPTLIEFTRHESPVMRRVALGGIGALQDQSAVPAVLERMHDTEPLVVFSACMTLGDLGDTRSRDLLADALDHPDYRVRAGAALNLSIVGPRMQDVEALIAHIEDPNNQVGRTIQNALSEVCHVNPRFLGRSRALWEEWWRTTGRDTIELPTT